MATCKIIYTDPEIASTVTKTVTVLATRGWGTPDDVQFFPALQHRYLSGGIAEQFAGFRRRITLDFGVVATLASQKQILYFLLNPARQIKIAIDAPTISSMSQQAGGSLTTNTEYFYKVTALDNVGETVGSVEDSQITGIAGGGGAGDNTVRITWGAVTGASSYKIYRTLSTGDYTTGGIHFLIETTAVTYDDTGAIALTQGQPPSTQTFTMALDDPSGYQNEWLEGAQIGAKYVVTLLEASIHQSFNY